MRTLIFLLFLFCILLSSAHRSIHDSMIHTPDIIIINIENELKQIQSCIPQSNLFFEIEYIPLESPDNKLIDFDPHIVVNDDYIITMDSHHCFVFDRNGKFLRKIGDMGRGPNEYKTSRGFVNSDKNKIYLLGWNNNFLEFDFIGNFNLSIPVPKHVDGFINPSITTNYTSFNNKFFAYFTNVTGTEKKLLIAFTSEGEIIKIYDNTNIFSEKHFSLSTGESHFYEYNNRLLFKENYCDTIYDITDGNYSPHMVLNSGKYLRPYESKWENNPTNESIAPYNLMESGSYFFFRLNFQNQSLLGIYNKNTRALNICQFNNCLINDIDGFISFTPTTIFNDHKIIGYLDAYRVEQWFKDNPQKAVQLPPHLKKLENITENDNPIVIIARLKE